MNIFSDLLRLLLYLNARISYKSKIAELFEVKKAEVHALYQELLSSNFISNILEKRSLRKRIFDFSMVSVLRAPTLYVISRLVKPEIVVETGVADGFSSAFVLFALQKNAKGKLYSIDLPNQPGHMLPGGRGTGWFVDAGLRSRWDLIIGSSKEKLPPLLGHLKKIDMFYHDSDHSLENMRFEFNAAYPYLGKNGVLISDDITDNNAFDEFFSQNCLRHIKLFKLGVIRV